MIDIPTQEEFFFILTENTLFVIAGRRNDLVKVVRSVDLKSLLPHDERKGA